jgi:hypothetical protein
VSTDRFAKYSTEYSQIRKAIFTERLRRNVVCMVTRLQTWDLSLVVLTERSLGQTLKELSFKLKLFMDGWRAFQGHHISSRNKCCRVVLRKEEGGVFSSMCIKDENRHLIISLFKKKWHNIAALWCRPGAILAILRLQLNQLCLKFPTALTKAALPLTWDSRKWYSNLFIASSNNEDNYTKSAVSFQACLNQAVN